MKIYKLFFSPTGGTKKVVDLLTSEYEDVMEVDLSERTRDFADLSFSKEEVCFVAVPSYGGRVPATAAERLRRMNGGGAKAVLVVSYGNRAVDDTLLELKDLLKERDFQPVAAVAAVTEHSTMHQFGTGRPDQEDQKELAVFSEKIRALLMKNAVPEDLSVPGNKPYREYRRSPMKLNVSAACTHCGTCARLCPVGAIPEDRPDTTDLSRCISCMRCVAVCPQKARKLDEAELAAHVERLRQVCSGHKANFFYC